MHSIGFEHEGFAAEPGRLVHRVALPLAPPRCEVPRRQVRRRARPRPRRRPRPVPGSRQLQVGPGPVLGLGALHGAARRADQAARARARSQVVTVKPGLRRQPERHGVPGRPEGRHECAGALPARRHQLRLPPHRAQRHRAARRRRRLRRRGPQTATPSPAPSCSSRTVQGDWIRTGGTAPSAWLHNPEGDEVVVPSTGRVRRGQGHDAGHRLRPRLPRGGGVRRHAGALPGPAHRSTRSRSSRARSYVLGRQDRADRLLLRQLLQQPAARATAR